MYVCVCVYALGKKKKKKKKENAPNEEEKKKEEEEKEEHGTFSSLHPANIQLGCSSSASSSTPHYYRDYRT